jgi:hypothetical protein
LEKKEITHKQVGDINVSNYKTPLRFMETLEEEQDRLREERCARPKKKRVRRYSYIPVALRDPDKIECEEAAVKYIKALRKEHNEDLTDKQLEEQFKHQKAHSKYETFLKFATLHEEQTK